MKYNSSYTGKVYRCGHLHRSRAEAVNCRHHRRRQYRRQIPKEVIDTWWHSECLQARERRLQEVVESGFSLPKWASQ